MKDTFQGVKLDTPDFVATMKGSHPKDCKCTYCDPPDCCRPIHDQEREYWEDHMESNKQEAYTLKPMTQCEQDNFLKQCNEEESKFKIMDHPWLISEDFNATRDDLAKWIKQCNDEEEEKREIEVKQAADAIADEIVRERLERPMKGMLVMYIDIGQLDSAKGEALIDRMKDKYLPVIRRLPHDWDVIYVPTRQGGTRVEMMKLE